MAFVLLAMAGVASYFGVRAAWTPDARPDGPAAASAPAMVDEVELPPGPHRDEFQRTCVLCHSPRLALNQPTLTREKWGETVHKMVSAYGAPLTPDGEAQIVEYLVAAQGDR
ncbi:MAG: hypothetical protein K8U57_13040 [Planctomycetes bacterium]|nr:hypothetical protein [Planctomycetota bacterium]